MSKSEEVRVTRLLQAAADGDDRAADELFPLLYSELRILASSWMRKLPPGQPLQTTALVNEATIRLLGKELHQFENRRHLLFAAGRAMRDILVEHARARSRQKRGGDRRRVDIDKITMAFEASPDELLELNEALDALLAAHPRLLGLVMLRFFAGLTASETADVLEISLRSVERNWQFARVWLHRFLSNE
jgi:RNA polymerase sigma factor (TIGR02999 family)